MRRKDLKIGDYIRVIKPSQCMSRSSEGRIFKVVKKTPPGSDNKLLGEICIRKVNKKEPHLLQFFHIKINCTGSCGLKLEKVSEKEIAVELL